MAERTQVTGNQVVTTPECRTIRIDMTSGTNAVVHAGAAHLRMVTVNTELGGDGVTFTNGSGGSEEDTIPSGSVPGYWQPYGDCYYPEGIYLEFDAAEPGDISVKYVPLDDRKASKIPTP